MANGKQTAKAREELDSREPWEPIEGETDKAFHAFTIYRTIHPFERSHPKVMERLDRKNGYQRIIEGWSAKNRWRERALSWDAHLARKLVGGQEAAHRAQIEAFRITLDRLQRKSMAISEQMIDQATAVLAGSITKDEHGRTVYAIPVDSIPKFVRAAAAIGNMAVESAATMFGVDTILEMTAKEPDG